MLDKIKFAVALFCLFLGLAGFYLLADQALVVRILSVLLGLGLCIAVVWRTGHGQRLRAFVEDSAVEVRKVVWPSRKETMQTTAVVFGFVIVMALLLYLTDKTLEWVMYDIILGRKR